MSQHSLGVLLLSLTALRFISGQWDCYDPGRREYDGTVSTACLSSTNGEECVECLPWGTVMDQVDSLGINRSLVLDIKDKNYCRFLNVDETDTAPKCFFNSTLHNSPVTRTCDIPPCDAHAGCMKLGNSGSYHDAAMYTGSGFQCLRWDDMIDQPVNPRTFPHADLTKNYCRNPNNRTGPWCYYRDQNNDTTWDYCSIPFCNSDSLSHFNRTVAATIDLSLGLLGRQPSISNAEDCARQCLDETDFTCRSFIFNEIQKHVHHPEGHCYLTNLSVFMLELYPEHKNSKHYDLFTRLDTVCDAYKEDSYPASCPLPLSIGNGNIAQIHASSYLDADHTPSHAHIGNHSSWQPHPADADPFMLINFTERVLITGLLVQGGGLEHCWLKTFKLRFGNDLSVFWNYERYLRLEIKPIIIKANGEPHCVKSIYLDPPIKARYLEINPLDWYGGIALRIEVLGCRDNDCDFAAGIARGDIHSSQITASSSVGDDRGLHGPANARLNPFGVHKSGWMSSMSDTDPWLQVYLPGVHQITAVVTQGCGNLNAWTPGYSIRYSADRNLEELVNYRSNGHVQIFSGNSDRHSLVRNNLDPPIRAEVFRIYPNKSTEPQTDICLRLELVGCKYRACGKRLGMESEAITQSQITESSEYIGQETDIGRLHHRACWKPNGMGDNHWIQVDLVTLHTVTGLITQGGFNEFFLGDQEVYYWPDSYRVLYTSWKDNIDWRKYYDLEGNIMNFPAYPDPHTETRHDFDRPFITQKIRIIPRSWRGYCLRLEIIGCKLSEGQVCGEASLQHDGFCVGSVNTQSRGACDDIFAEASQPITINSLATQQWLGVKRDDIKVNDRRYQYKVGLSTRAEEEAFHWSDGTPMTFVNFRWPANITDNSTEWCVYVDMNDEMRWREFQCRNDAVPRATICQLDLDECAASNSHCSHDCANFPGGFQCLCPRGFRLANMDDSVCTTLCNEHENTSIDCFADPFDPSCLGITIELPGSENPWTQGGFSVDSDSSAVSTLVPVLLEASTCNDVADVRCEEMWARNVNLEYVYSKQGYIHSMGFPPWYNQASTCQINIQIPPGNSVRLEIHEMVLRRKHRTSRCIDVLNITDHLTPHHSMSRGSFCGKLRDLVVTCRSNNVTLKLDIGDIGQDMPKKLGFMASYTMADCTSSAGECDPGCGTKEVLTSPSGNFSTTNFPSKLPPFSICTWNINLRNGSYIALNFSEFQVDEDEDNTECVDFVQVFLSDSKGKFKDAPAGPPMCGSKPSLIVSNSSTIQVVFRTGLDSKSLGFQAHYQSTDIPGCGIGFYHGDGIQHCTMSKAAIASENYPRPYLAGTSSVWHITTHIGTYIELVFVTFDVPDPYGISNVQVHDGVPDRKPAMLLAKLSNNRRPRGPIRSSFNEMTVRFRGDGSVAGNGFYAEYRAKTFIPEIDLNTNRSKGQICLSERSFFNGKCYAFRTTNHSLRWTDAQRLCTAESANLVSINDYAEMNFIHRLMTSEWLTNNSNTYIGLRYNHNLQQHRWQDESPLSYADWSVPRDTGSRQIVTSLHVTNSAPQPDGGALERCSQIILRNLHSTSHWHDVPCASKNSNQFICEKLAEIPGESAHTPRGDLQVLHTAVCPARWTLIGGLYCTKPLLNQSGTFVNRCPGDSKLATLMDPEIDHKLPYFMQYVWGLDSRASNRFLIGLRGSGDHVVYDVMMHVDGHWTKVHERDANEVHGAVCAKEATAIIPQCESSMFTCGTGECIHTVFVCDHQDDCMDKSDEASCINEVGVSGSVCTDTSFKCGSGECISLSFYCDFYPHCHDGLDEADCSVVTCTDSEFRCDSGQCIRNDLHCNLVVDCVDGTDEHDCVEVQSGFQCYDGAWLPGHSHCDGTKDCPGNNREDEPKETCVLFQCSSDPNLIQCNNGACADRSHMCLYDFDQYGYQTGCRDVTHLRFCDNFECSNNTFKCPGSYCIPLHRRCDVIKDCPGGEDELNCDNYTCVGHYRCRGSRICVAQSHVCDGIKQCPAGDDELFCEARCPEGCSCAGLSYTCTGVRWTPETANQIPRNVRKLKLHNGFGVSRQRRDTVDYNVTVEYSLYLPLEELQQLAELDLSGNGIDALKPRMFQKQNNVYKLVLADNNIRKLKNRTFEGLHRLQRLNLSGNPLVEIESGAFWGVVSLPVLDLGQLEVRHLQDGVFEGLDALEVLNVRDNPLSAVERGAFYGLDKTQTLDIRGTHIIKVDPEMFEGLESLETLYADKYLFCCLLGDSVATCEAPMDELSSCEDLMRNPILRVFIWILGFSALVGNAFVIVWRIRIKDREQSRKIQTFLILNLAVADLLMGVYMIAIASADLHYRSDYMIHAEEWQESIVCQMAGFISVLSSESSIFLLVLITTDRFLGVVFPFSRWRLHTKSARYAVAGLWSMAFLLSLLPVVLKPAFGDRFYGRSSVCLALPFTQTKLPGWEYSVVLFLGVNLLGFLVIFICYFFMYIAIKRASKQCTRKREHMEEIKMATKMGIIVGTDFFCWMPIIIMGLLSLSGTTTIPQEMYAWAAVFMLPVNSAANPYLYTISSLDRKRKKARTSTSSPTWKTECTRDVSQDFEMVKYAKTDSNSKDNHSLMSTVITDQMEHRVLPLLGRRGYSFLLRQYIAEVKTPLGVSVVSAIENDLRRALDFLHKSGIAHGRIDEDFVAIDKERKEDRIAFLIMRGEPLDGDDSSGSGASSNEEEVPLLRRDYRQLDELLARLRGSH